MITPEITCQKCHISKPITDFNIKSHKGTCRACINATSRAWYEAHKQTKPREYRRNRKILEENTFTTCRICGLTTTLSEMRSKFICRKCNLATVKAKKVKRQQDRLEAQARERALAILNACRNRPTKRLPDREIYTDNENWAIDNFRFYADFSYLHTVSLSELTVDYHIKKAEERQKWIDRLHKKSKKINYFSEDLLNVDNEEDTEGENLPYAL